MREQLQQFIVVAGFVAKLRLQDRKLSSTCVYRIEVLPVALVGRTIKFATAEMHDR
jgi:hypothetical protein